MAKLSQEEILQQITKATSRRGNAEDATELDVSLGDIESFGDNESLRGMLKNIGKYNKMLKERITLINDSLSAAIPFTRENLYLFCGYSGNGKSTTAANISYPLWKQGKKILVISNEESEQDVVFRIAALELGLNFNDYKKGIMSTDQQKQCLTLFPEITKYVKVIDVNYKNGLTTKIEGVMNCLKAVKEEEGYSCVLIDYYQLIKFSAKHPDKTTYENLNDLRVYIGQFIKSANMPVVLFAQLYSLSKRGGAKDIDARLKECSAIVEPATVIIEIVPDFENHTSSFVIHKDRFGRAGQQIVCGFDKGRYVKLSADDISDRSLQGKLSAGETKLDQLEAMIKHEYKG